MGLFTINTKLYPTAVRSIGVGWGNFFTKLGGLISPIVTGYIFEFDWGYQVVLLLAGLIYAIVGVATAFFDVNKNKNI